MTRFFATAAIAVCSVVFNSLPARAQAANSSSDLQCFPWQEIRDGRCVAKPGAAPQPPAPAPAPIAAPQPSTDPCSLRGLSSQCKCPAATHLDAASGTCVADAPVTPAAPPPVAPLTPKPSLAIVCAGGTVTNGTCVCPSGFSLMSTDGNAANGGTCVKAHADNCLGGELTVSGTCLCNGQVVMSGETYGLEYVNGKCVPKRCPEQTVLKSGKCIALSTSAAVPEPAAAKPASAKETADEEEHRRHCEHGIVHTHSGCAPARRRSPVGIGAIPPDLQRYYRNYQTRGF